MGCAGCTSTAGTPKGCGSKGHCATGGCNMMNTYDWLNDMPIAFGNEQNELFEVSFNNGTRKDFYKNSKKLGVNTGDLVKVETGMGTDIGRITLSGELVKLQMKKKNYKERVADIRSIVGFPTEEDMQRWEEAKALEQDTMVRARAIARQLNLDMKVGQVEYQADKKKATFFYIADNRVDFRELIKVYAREFKVKIEMRQIGARQEAGRIGGFGSCGRELCCSTWLSDFKSVTTSAARYQNLSINLSKLSGQCGRLKCCLNYELDTYMEALQEFPKKADVLKLDGGDARLMKTDILQRLMWYVQEGSSTFYPLTVEQVHDIIELNKKGKSGQALGQIAVRTGSIEEEEEVVDYVDTVGHISLETLEKGNKKKKRNKRRNKGKGGNKGGNQQQAKQQDGGQVKAQTNDKGPQKGGGGNKRRSNRNRNRYKGGNNPQNKN